MAAPKSTTLTFRIEPSLKEALRLAADQEHRSVANMVEVMIREYCDRIGVATATAEQPVQRGTAPMAKARQKKYSPAKNTT